MYREQSDDRPDLFFAQFEWDGTDAIYRGNRTGPAYRVTNDEYHRFVDDHERWCKWINWTSVLAGLIFMAVVFFVPPFSNFASESTTWGILFFAALILPLLSWAIAHRWLRLAPARALRGRMTVAPALSKEEQLLVWAGDHSWGSFFWQAFYFSFLGVSHLVPPHASGREVSDFWFAVFCGAIVALNSALMLRKWMVERRYGVTDHTANTLT